MLKYFSNNVKEGIMERIESFKVNHLNLNTGLYVSRKDKKDGVTVTTFDLRFTAPNKEKALDCSSMHTIEHLGATFLRNGEQKSDIVYFGPMGCRTGFYLVMFGDLTSEDVYPLVVEMCQFITQFSGGIPGASPIECGNYSDQNLEGAKNYTAKYLQELTENKNFLYND